MRRRLLSLLGCAAVVVACGSRTGLFADELAGAPPSPIVDAAPDAPTEVPCIPGRFTFELALTQLMFVLDRSRSMTFDLDGNTVVPRSQWRWTALERALRQTITGFDQQIAMGAKFYPEPSEEDDDFAEACRTDVGPGIAPQRGNASAILSVFGSTVPIGGTPTAEAVRLAAQFLAASRSVARTIVLATDGAPNCNGDLDANTCTCTSFGPRGNPNCDAPFGEFSCLDDRRAVDVVRQVAEQQRIPVYVIGIGSTESPQFLRVLSDMAVAGGRPRAAEPRHYSAQSAEELESALTTIRDAVAKCTYLTPSSPTDPNAITVSIDGRVIARDQTKQNGWDWVDQAFGELAFFGESCTLAQAGSPTAVSGVVSCE